MANASRNNQPTEERSHQPAEISPEKDTEASETGFGEGDSVAARAYRRFEERGREHGRDLEDWFEAEREFTDKSSE